MNLKIIIISYIYIFNSFTICTNNTVSGIFEVDDDEWDDKFIDKYCIYKSENALHCGLKWITLEPLGQNNTKFIPENAVIKEVEVNLKVIKVLKRTKFLHGKDKSIETLNFYSNNISKIEPMMFDNFDSLKVLKLNYNNITFIDDTILTPKLGLTLTELDLRSNKIQQLTSSSFKNMHKLIHLNLVANENVGTIILKYNIFPKALSNLKVLNLMFCNITVLKPHVFINLTNLEELLLQENFLTSFPHAINHLSNLRYLNLGGSKITTLKYQPSIFNPKLEELDFFRSKNLIEVGDCAFCSFPNLKIISFWSSQKLTKIHENAFGGLSKNFSSKIEKFNIQSCNISTLSSQMLPWDNVKELAVSDNPWKCDCGMAWFINDLNEKYLKKLKSVGIRGGSLANLKCYYPLNLKAN